ncbi:MAG: dihydropteroate synthase [Alphaproteobacteria bacterium]|nr:dihydropteroate synthase [Alphaproteobacteria bacterium]
MSEHIAFLTGHLALPRLQKVLAGMEAPGFTWSVIDIGVKVAALMTEPIIARRLPRPLDATRIMVPGRCRADLERLSAAFGIPFERGPEELKDLPAYFGKGGRDLDLSRSDVRIFAEIVEAAALTVTDILARARTAHAAGADVIDLGCLPDTSFPHLGDAVRALIAEGHAVSVDSADPDELQTGARAGAQFLLSLTETTLSIAAESGATPVLVPATHGDLASLLRAAEAADKLGIKAILDPILDPIHFGFMASLARYAALRQRLPQSEILMGTGNLTELTDADSGGVTAALLGICSELEIRNVLLVQVSPHTRRTIEEHDAARRMMFAARADHSLPKDYGAALLQLHDRKPFPNRPEEIVELAARVTDGNFRIETAADGIHIYAREVHHVATDAFALFPKLALGADAAHAFYLGAELQKAEIAWRLGKRYIQDEPLDWGCAVDRTTEDLTRLRAAGHTLRAAAPARAAATDEAEGGD